MLKPNHIETNWARERKNPEYFYSSDIGLERCLNLKPQANENSHEFGSFLSCDCSMVYYRYYFTFISKNLREIQINSISYRYLDTATALKCVVWFSFDANNKNNHNRLAVVCSVQMLCVTLKEKETNKTRQYKHISGETTKQTEKYNTYK